MLSDMGDAIVGAVGDLNDLITGDGDVADPIAGGSTPGSTTVSTPGSTTGSTTVSTPESTPELTGGLGLSGDELLEALLAALLALFGH